MKESDQEILSDLLECLLTGVKSMDGDFSSFVDEHFWDLI